MSGRMSRTLSNPLTFYSETSIYLHIEFPLLFILTTNIQSDAFVAIKHFCRGINQTYENSVFDRDFLSFT